MIRTCTIPILTGVRIQAGREGTAGYRSTLSPDSEGFSNEDWSYDSRSGTLKNHSGQSQYLRRIELQLESPFQGTSLYCQKKMMADGSWMESSDGEHHSWYLIAFEAQGTPEVRLLGFKDLSEWFCGFTCRKEGSLVNRVTAFIEGEGTCVPSGKSIQLPTIIQLEAETLFEAQREYAEQVASVMGSRVARTPSGWCSWYYYYDTLSSEDLWKNVKALKAQGYDRNEDFVIQIDDGWNLPAKGAQKVWGDWEAGALFPEGMGEAATRIHASGFKAGLWLAPFTVAPGSRLFAEHPEWTLQQDGQPAVIYGIHALDLSRPEVREHLREVFSTVFDSWGYDYVKLDFLHFAIEQGERFDTSKSAAHYLRLTMQMIRELAGERFVLACGAPFGPLVGTVDGMRIGHDISSRWELGIDPKNAAGPYISVGIAAHQTLLHQWMHRCWWANDPDCFITRDYAPQAEKELFGKVLTQYSDTIPYGLTDTEARTWRDIIWMTGTMCLIGENMQELKGERLTLLSSVFPQYDGQVALLGPGDDKRFILAGRREPEFIDTLVLINLGDTPQLFELPEEFGPSSVTIQGRSSMIRERKTKE